MLEAKFGHKPSPSGVWEKNKNQTKHLLSYLSDYLLFNIHDSRLLPTQNIDWLSLNSTPLSLFSRLFSQFHHAYYVSKMMVSDKRHWRDRGQCGLSQKSFNDSTWIHMNLRIMYLRIKLIQINGQIFNLSWKFVLWLKLFSTMLVDFSFEEDFFCNLWKARKGPWFILRLKKILHCHDYIHKKYKNFWL